MKLKEIFDQLNTGELSVSNLGLGIDSADDNVKQENYTKLVRLVNLATTNLHSRFPLKRGSVTIRLEDSVNTYDVSSERSVNNPKNPKVLKYVLDSKDDPFNDDILLMDGFILSNGVELSKDRLDDPNSIRTLSTTKILVPRNIVNNNDELTIHYRANGKQISVGYGYFDPERVDVDLPEALIEPLVYHVASRVLGTEGISEGLHSSGYYLRKYHEACKMIEDSGLFTFESNDSFVFENNGFV